MKKKIFLTLITWLGLIIILAGTYMSFLSSYNDLQRSYQNFTFNRVPTMATLGYFITLLIGFVGAAISLVGGFSAKSSYLWMALLIVGIIYIISMVGLIPLELHYYEMDILSTGLTFLLFSLPGIACITGSVIIKQDSGKKIVNP